MGLIAIEDFIRNPPSGVYVENQPKKSRVGSLSDKVCIFMDDFATASGRKVVFSNSFGRIVQVKTMIEYSKVRKILTSKLLLILVSACEKKAGERRRRADNQAKVLKQFILIINGNNPMIKWEMERGLNDVFSSVSSENFTVKIDLKETLQKWTQDQGFAITVGPRTVTPDWLNTTFNLNYESDASCDFPYWFGFSKRRFSLHGKIVYLRNRTIEEKHNLEELFLAFVSEPS
ncbi:mesenteric estrogen-dependent adipogenesis protein-like [Bombina bombina]|nr:mesenteric estrogen-dependent adipogenesis protein-like [Bombina bombina]